MIYQPVTDSAICDEEFALTSNEAKNYLQLKQDIRMMKSKKKMITNGSLLQ